MSPTDMQSEKLRAVRDTAALLLARREPGEVLPHILEQAVKGVGGEAGAICLADLQDNTLVFRHVTGGAGPVLDGYRIPLTSGIAGLVYSTGMPALTRDATNDPAHLIVPGGCQAGAMLTVPLRGDDGRVAGVLQVLRNADAGVFDEDADIPLIETLAALSSVSIATNRQQDTERRTASVLSAVHRVAINLFTHTSVDEIVAQALESAMQSVDAMAGAVLIHDPRDDTLVFRHVVGGAGSAISEERIPATQGIAGAVFQSGDPIVTVNATEDPRHVDVARDYHTESMVTVPMRNVSGRGIGVMQVLNKADHGTFSTHHDLPVLEILASLAATAIESAEQAEHARKAAVADAVAFIAHDIKNAMTPLQAWAAYMDSLGDEAMAAFKSVMPGLSSEIRAALGPATTFFEVLPEGLAGIRESSHQALNRSAEIADAVRGHVRPPSFVCEDVLATLRRVSGTLMPCARNAGLEIRVDGHCRPFPHDCTHIFNAVYNLVSNAIPHVGRGGTIRICLSEVDEFAEIAVLDNGHGMPENVRASLFTEQTISTSKGGSGLGTQIVARVAAAHHGFVLLESELGKGSAFRLRIPLVQNTDDDDAPASDSFNRASDA